MAEILRLPIAGIIQEDENIHIAMNSGIPVVCRKGFLHRKELRKYSSAYVSEIVIKAES